jgi:hypothetical protein
MIFKNRFFLGFMAGYLATIIVGATGLIVGLYLGGFFNQLAPLVPMMKLLPTTFL